eukprot:EG_transcript_6700
MGWCTRLIFGAFALYVLLATWVLAVALWPPESIDPTTAGAIRNAFRPSEPFQTHVYLSSSATPCNSPKRKGCQLLHNFSGLSYDSATDVQAIVEVAMAGVRAERFVQVILVLSDQSWQAAEFHVCSAPITRWLPPRQDFRTLLKGTTSGARPVPMAPRLGLARVVPLHVVVDATTYRWGAVPPEVGHSMTLTTDRQYYAPFAYVNDLWLTNEHFAVVNATSDTVVNVTLHATAASLFQYRLYLYMREVLREFKRFGLTERDIDVARNLLFRNSASVLLAMIVLSVVHLLLDALSFKNDVQHWRRSTTARGISARAVVLSAVSQLVLLLYLLDNDTSYIISGPHFIGTVIAFWKMTKALRISVVYRRVGGVSLPVNVVRRTATVAEAKTEDLDQEAAKWLGYLLYPLGVGYALYSLKYHTEQGWYSWILGTITGYLYIFGFIMMTPQLFINYRLKSVAHLPWRALTYRAFNTVVDDVFAFLIKMPTMHRVACFRDDVVFLIYLYQRYIYPIDPSRVEGDHPAVRDLVPTLEQGRPTSPTTPEPSANHTPAEGGAQEPAELPPPVTQLALDADDGPTGPSDGAETPEPLPDSGESKKDR